MGHFNSNLAREAGRLVRWREKFWGRRYQAIPISEEEAAQVERLRYVPAHGCKEGLVELLRDWPGVSAVRALLDEEPLSGYWFDRTREHQARRRGLAFERLELATPCTVNLEPLPCWAHLSAEEYRGRIAELVADVEGQAALRAPRPAGQGGGRRSGAGASCRAGEAEEVSRAAVPRGEPEDPPGALRGLQALLLRLPRRRHAAASRGA
jgi:hypothetical protein